MLIMSWVITVQQETMTYLSSKEGVNCWAASLCVCVSVLLQLCSTAGSEVCSLEGCCTQQCLDLLLTYSAVWIWFLGAHLLPQGLVFQINKWKSWKFLWPYWSKPLCVLGGARGLGASAWDVGNLGGQLFSCRLPAWPWATLLASGLLSPAKK